MDVNLLIRKIRRRLGLNGILSNVVKDDEILEIIQEDTLETFSEYFSHMIKINKFYCSMDNCIDQINQMYRLPDELIHVCKSHGIKVMSMQDIVSGNSRYPEVSNIPGGSLMGNPNIGLYAGHQHINAGYARSATDLYREAVSAIYMEPYTIKFDMEYKLPLNQYFDITIRVTHPKNLMTIKGSYAETFRKLAILDCKIALWSNVVQFLNNLEVGSGQIYLQKDEWASAEAQRDELIESFNEELITEYPTIINV